MRLRVFVQLSALLCCPLLLACGTRARSADAGPVGKGAATPIQAEVLTVAPSNWPTIVRTQGSLAADLVAVVGTKVAGRSAVVHVDLGDQVQAGDPLATLDQAES